MTQKILIPLDGSTVAEGILTPLSHLLERDAEVTLLQVSEPGSELDREPLGPLSMAATKALVSVEARLAQTARARVKIVRGDPATEIVRHARETGQTLIAMATHGRTGLDRWLRGSVAERVLRTTRTPLLLCNPRGFTGHREGPFRKILVPLDGSSEADQVLPHVIELARAYGARVSLLRVEPLIVTEFPSPLLEGSLWDPAATTRSLEPQRERLRAAGLEVETIAAYGVVALEILRAASDSDLLAMSTHGRSGPSRWWFGSVAEQVLREARVPLLVVRAGGEASP
jgi:nucleotide-binding universal stress UspA family protein